MIKACSLLIPLLLASCTMGPDYERPVFWEDKELESSLEITADSTPIHKNWFHVFKNEELNRLVDEALKHNLNVKTAISRLRQARYSLNIGKVQYLPMIDADGDYNYKYATEYGEYGNKNSFYNVGFDVSWEVDIWGEGRRQTENLTAIYQSTAADLDNVLLTVTTEVASNYFAIAVGLEELRIARNNLAVQENILELVRDKYKSGLVGEEDINQARFAVENTKAMIPDLEQQIKVYENVVAILLGRLPSNEIYADKMKNAAKQKFDYDIKKLRQFPISVVRERPDVRAAEKLLTARNAEIGEAIAAMFPNISLSGALGRQAHKFDELNYAKYAAYGYTPMINMPFLHWGELWNKVKMNEAAKDEALYTYQNVMLEAVNEIKNAMSSVENEYRKNTALKNAATDMRKVLNALKAKYKEGLIEFGDLLNAEQNLLTAEANLVKSNGQIYKNIIGFYKAVGGGYY